MLTSEICYYNEIGQLHRLDGAAVEEYFAYTSRRFYYINGVYYNFKKYLQEIKDNYPEYFPIVFSKFISNNFDKKIYHIELPKVKRFIKEPRKKPKYRR